MVMRARFDNPSYLGPLLESTASDTSWHTTVDVHINHRPNLSIFSCVNPTCPYTERERHTCEQKRISFQTAPLLPTNTPINTQIIKFIPPGIIHLISPRNYSLSFTVNPSITSTNQVI